MSELLEEHSQTCKFPYFVARSHPVAKMLTLQQKGILCLEVHKDHLCNNCTRAAIYDCYCQFGGTGCLQIGKNMG